MEESIIEGNKLIAEFMGYRTFSKRYPRNHGIGAPEAFEDMKDMIIEKAKYHSSFDWLIPVCKKWDIFFEGVTVDKIIYHDYERLSDNLDDAATLYDIIPLFNQLVENIKWYNKTNKHQ